VDDLLEFAYELDYEKYMEDFEVRQALAVIKDRVDNIKQEPDWKQKMADEWNQAAQDEQVKQDDARSVAASQRTGASRVSTQSYAKKMAEARKEAADRPDWDSGSMTSEAKHKKAENRMAQQIAADVLKDNPKLKGVHSKESIKKLLEKEALKQMQEGGYPEPNIVRNNERQRVDKGDPSNLPYLHKNPAV
jgi:hypothetical protein